jgi:hypothetical protein
MEQLSKSREDNTSVARTEDNIPQCDSSEMNDREKENSVPNVVSALEKHFRKFHPSIKIIKTFGIKDEGSY